MYWFSAFKTLFRSSFSGLSRNFFPIYIGNDGWGTNEVILERIVRARLAAIASLDTDILLE